MIDYEKELERSDRLYEAYLKQKKRLTKILEYDCKEIGMSIASDHLKVSNAYLYKMFDGGSISFRTLRDLYCRVQELKKMVGL